MSGHSFSCRLGLVWEKKDLRGGATSHANVHPSALQMALLAASGTKVVCAHPPSAVAFKRRGETHIQWVRRKGLHARNSLLQRTTAAEKRYFRVPCRVHAKPFFALVEYVFLFATAKQRPRVHARKVYFWEYFFTRGILATFEGTYYYNTWNFLLPHIESPEEYSLPSGTGEGRSSHRWFVACGTIAVP